MKSTIEKLSRGKIEYELPVMGVSISEITVKVEAGSIEPGHFEIFSVNGLELKGVIFATTEHFKLEMDQFVGTKAQIRYTVSAEHLISESDIDGELHIVSNGGETLIPYHIHVEERSYNSSIGQINNYESFVALTREHFDEGVKLFLYPDFADVVIGNHFEHRALYQGLSEGVNPDLALEEFLVSIGEKEKITLTLESVEKRYSKVADSIRDCVVLKKNTWGYAEIEAEIQGDFLLECRAKFNAQDFEGDSFEYRYCIDKKKLRLGKNYGKITFKTCGEQLECMLIVEYAGQDIRDEVDNRKLLYQLMDLYIKFRMQQYNYEKWTNDSMLILDRLRRNDESDLMIRLMKAQMCLIKGKKEEAAFILDYVQGQLPNQRENVVEMRCYYDYVRTLQYRNSEYTQKVVTNIQRIYEEQNSGWQLLWILLFIDERYEKNKSLKYAMIKERCCKGCSSPLLYFEALSVLNEQPGLLRVLNSFELRMLMMGAKRKNVSLRLTLQAADLAKKERSFRPLVFELLVRLYEQYQTNDILSAICVVLIRGSQTANKYFKWFELAVKNDLKIPKLYEYYLLSINPDTKQILPQMVYLYFVYNTDSIRERERFLFANIIEQREEIPHIYESYQKIIEQYSLRQMLIGSMDEYLAVIYEAVLSKALVTDDIAKRLPAMIACHKIVCKNPRMRRVIVIHKENGTEKIYPILGGVAYVRIYTQNASVIFQDADGNRYSKGIDYTVTKLMDMEYYMKLCYEMHPESHELRLHFGEATKKGKGKPNKLPEMITPMMEIDNLDEAYRTALLEALVDYYYHHIEEENIKRYLQNADIHRMQSPARGKVIELMILCGMYSQVYVLLKQYGAADVDAGLLSRFLTRIIPKLEQCEDETVTRLCRIVFDKGIYDDNILKYMSRYYNGTFETLLHLWTVAKKFAFYSLELEERMIAQALFSGSTHPMFPEAFRKYYCYGYREVIMNAYVNKLSYLYVVKGECSDLNLFKYLKYQLVQGEPVHDYGKVAYVKYCGEHKGEMQKDSLEEKVCAKAISDLIKKNIYLEYFRAFSELTDIPAKFTDKSYVSYGENPKHAIYMRYRMLGEERYHLEPMEQILPGLYEKGFVLFSDDILEYEIIRKEGENEVLLKKDVFSAVCQETKLGGGCYDMIQAMIDVKHNLKKQEDLMKEYEEKRELARILL
ncbi:MAG: hypothetical protein E7269_06075 [Lachnospiraceae bacterium]|nr:hypothetical protein [Lachnospiraceae bacterium]